MKRIAVDGNEAIAYAMRQIEPDVVFAYPITPQTPIVETFSEYVADGKVQTLFYNTESEHSALSACIGAAAAGARTMTATSSQGLAMLWEMLYIASGLHLPIVMPVVNRALSAPINIHCDHSDSMGARDSGWIQIYCEDAQEAYDLTICAVKIAEKTSIPCMVMSDGFIVSHNIQSVVVLDDKDVKEFVGEWEPKYTLLKKDEPITVGAFTLFDYYFEHKRLQQQRLQESLKIIEEVFEEWERLCGRRYKPLNIYNEEAKYCIFAQGSVCGTTRSLIEEEKDIGLAKLTLYRPFPKEHIKEYVLDKEAIAVMDRCICFGIDGGPIFADIRSTLYGERKIPILNYIYGLGGRDTGEEHIREVIRGLREGEEGVRYLGVRE